MQSIILHDQKRILTITQTLQATDFKRTTAVAQALNIDYKEDDISYIFNLKTEHVQNSGQLSKDSGKCACTLFRIPPKPIFSKLPWSKISKAAIMSV